MQCFPLTPNAARAREGIHARLPGLFCAAPLPEAHLQRVRARSASCRIGYHARLGGVFFERGSAWGLLSDRSSSCVQHCPSVNGSPLACPTEAKTGRVRKISSFVGAGDDAQASPPPAAAAKVNTRAHTHTNSARHTRTADTHNRTHTQTRTNTQTRTHARTHEHRLTRPPARAHVRTHSDTHARMRTHQHTRTTTHARARTHACTRRALPTACCSPTRTWDGHTHRQACTHCSRSTRVLAHMCRRAAHAPRVCNQSHTHAG
jgi:hypothetical protein